MVNPVILALDFASVADAKAMAKMVHPHVGAFKVGLELFWSDGPDAVREIVALGLPVFVDAKLHDIPNTVHRASVQLAKLGTRWVTVHASGGRAMIEAAVDGMRTGSAEAGVLAVTVLTSLGPADLRETGFESDLHGTVRALTDLARSTGAEGVVCGVSEVAIVKKSAPGLLAVTPAIRQRDSRADDQARIATPRRAIESGADLLVVGRAITAAEDPVAAAAAIAEDVAALG